MYRCSLLLIIREVQIKTTMRCHLTPVRMAIIKKSTNNKGRGGCGEDGTLLHYWWEFKLMQPLWKTKNRVTTWSSSLTPAHLSVQKYNLERYLHPYVHCNIIHNSQDMEETQMVIRRWMDKEDVGIPIVAQQVTNLTSIHEEGVWSLASLSGFKDLAFPWAMV